MEIKERLIGLADTALPRPFSQLGQNTLAMDWRSPLLVSPGRTVLRCKFNRAGIPLVECRLRLVDRMRYLKRAVLYFGIFLFPLDVCAQAPPRVGDHKQQLVPGEHNKIAEGIGLLLRGRRSFCTAFCLKENVIATAAHCIAAKNRPLSRSLGDLTFQLPGKKRASSRIHGEQANKQFNTFLGTTKRSGNIGQSHYDWAIARLDRPICRGRELEVANLAPNELYSDDNKLISIFYQNIRGRIRVRFSRCQTGIIVGNIRWPQITANKPFPDDIILHNCGTKPGSSGAPLILFAGGGPKVVGINRGFFIDDSDLVSDANGAVHIRSILPYIKRLSGEIEYPSKDVIKRTQQLLKETGDYKSGIDGKYGRGTRQAIIDFTRRHSLPVMFDRPIDELLPIIEANPTTALPQEMLNGFESYLYNPNYRRHKAFALHLGRKSYGYWYGLQSNQNVGKSALINCYVAANRGKKKRTETGCEIYAMDNRIVYKSGISDGPTNHSSEKYFENEGIDLRLQLPIYINKKGVDYKAAAVDLKGGILHACYQQPTFDGASKCALNKCNINSSRCKAFAVGNKVVLGLDGNEAGFYRAYYEAVIDPSTNR